MLLLLVPSAIYTFLFVGQKFPATEREAAGVPFNDMFKELLRPLFLVIWFSMCLTAVTELGPGQWYANVFNEVIGQHREGGRARARLGERDHVSDAPVRRRHLASRVADPAHRDDGDLRRARPLPLQPRDVDATAFMAAAFLAVGTAFWWPTMLGITSERFPKAGALGLAVVGGTGSIATAIAGPVMGALNDRFGPRDMLAIWAIIPVVLIVIFGAIYMRDKAAGGYRVEKIGA